MAKPGVIPLSCSAATRLSASSTELIRWRPLRTAARTLEVVGRATNARTAAGLACTSMEEVDPSGMTLVVVRCSGAVPM